VDTIDYFKWDPDGGSSLSEPHLTFDIEDADPHKYCCIIRFRQTIGSGTWDWDSGWWSMRKDFGSQTANCDINLTQEDYQGDCLNEDDHEWGTYTYEILVLEYEDEAVWTEGEALDSNFLKRCENGYKFWVPEHLPAPAVTYVGDVKLPAMLTLAIIPLAPGADLSDIPEIASETKDDVSTWLLPVKDATLRFATSTESCTVSQ